jgi:hypothetical protein
LDLQIYLRGGNAITFMPELVHADPTDLAFSLELTAAEIKLCLHKDNSLETLQALEFGDMKSKPAWLEVVAYDSNLTLKVYEFEVSIGIGLGQAMLESAWLMPHLRDQTAPPNAPRDLLDERFTQKPMVILTAIPQQPEEGRDKPPMIQVDILANDLYSPTLGDAEIVIDVNLSPLDFKWAPILLNDTI